MAAEEADEGGKECECGGGQVHDVVRESFRLCEDCGGGGRGGRGVGSGDFWRRDNGLVVGLEELVGGGADEGVAVFAEGADELGDLLLGVNTFKV